MDEIIYVILKLLFDFALEVWFSIEPDFPCLADEIAKPRPDKNIKVTAFTESKEFYNISYPIRKVRDDMQYFPYPD